MILECVSASGQQSGLAAGYSLIGGGKRRFSSLESELNRVERSIRDIVDKTKTLADELGARYVVFRCSKVRYGDGREAHGSDLINLSREADDYIEAIYMLEQRRKELLEKIDRSIG